MTTRSASANVFEHIITQVFKMKMDEEVASALTLNKSRLFTDIMTMSETDIQSLDYLTNPADPKSRTLLARGHRALVRAFQAYVIHQGATSGSEILTFTSAEFDKFRVSCSHPTCGNVNQNITNE